MLVETLRKVTLFADLEAAELGRLAEKFSERVLPAGHLVYQHGDASDTFYVVREGSVTLFRDQPGKPVQLLARLGPGDFFGELELFDGGERSASARTGETTRILKIDRRDLLAVLEERPAIAVRLQMAAARRRSENVSAALDLGQRQDLRIRLGKDVLLELTDGAWEPAVLENLSPGGLCLSGAPAEWQRHWTVRFTLIHGTDRLPVVGRVAWRQDDTVGLASSRLRTDHDEQVQRFQRRLLGAARG